jgi:hypothetical protein
MYRRKKIVKRLARSEASKIFSSSRQLRSSEPLTLFQLDYSSQPIPISGALPESLNSAVKFVAPAIVSILPDSSDDEMAESFSLGPPIFNGTLSQDAKTWLSSLEHFTAYKGIDNDKKLALFKLRLGETARDWLTTLPAEKQNNFDNLKAAFLERFQPKELEKFRFAKDIFNQKQQPGQTVDAFITELKVKAAVVGMDAKSQLWAALNGLLPQISAYVVEHSPDNVDDVLKYARIAEMTRGITISTSDDMSLKLEQLTQQMTFLTTQMSSMTAAAIDSRERADTAEKRVTFREQRSRSNSPFRADVTAEAQTHHQIFRNASNINGGTQNRTGQRYVQNWQRRDNQRPQAPQRFDSQQNYNSRVTDVQQTCTRCGRAGGHSNPLYCPMLNQTCFSCGKPGHSYRVCRSRQTMQPQY